MNFLKLKEFCVKQKDKKLFILAVNLFFSFVYFLVSSASLKLATLSSSVTPIWPSTGLAISILILFGRRYSFAIFAGAMISNAQTSPLLLNAFAIAIGNTLEALLGHLIYIKLRAYNKRFVYLTDLVTIGSASFIAPVVSASIGVFSLRYFGLISKEIQFNVWATWWSADVIGALLVIPLILSFKYIELVKLCLKFKNNFKKQFFYLLISLFPLIFFYQFFLQTMSFKYIFLFFPLIVFISFIANRFLIHLLTLFLAAEALYVTSLGNGPFNFSSINQNLLNLEIFIGAIALAILVLSGLIRLKFIGQIRILLISGWLFWGGIFYYIQLDRENIEVTDFKVITSDIENKIEEKMRDYFQILASGRALFMASRDVDAKEWKAFVESLDLSKNYDGMNGIGAVFKLDSKDLQHHVEKSKINIDSNFTYKRVPFNLGDQSVFAEDHFVITYIEPFERNKAARGLDLGSESNRRIAAERAIVTGAGTMSDRIRLIQDQKKRLGFLIYLPVYKKNLPTTTAEERKKAFLHWIYAPFVTETFLNSIFNNVVNENVSFQVYDRPERSSSSLVYSFQDKNINNNYKITNTIKLGDKVFYTTWSKLNGVMTSRDYLTTWIGLIGTIIVLIIVLFFINIQALEEKSKSKANILHQDYLESQLIVKEQEVRMIESRKMATLGEMASSIAHEINNPLAIIAGNNSLIKRALSDVSGDLDRDKLFKYSEKIEKTASRVDKIIKGLRLFSRDATLDPMASASVDALIEDTLSLCSERFRTAGVLLSLENDYHGEILCRGTQISQVLINLLNNSFDAILDLDEKWIKIIINQNENNLVIRIIDSGHGIPSEIQSKILEPFFTTKEVGKGTGLGLSISKGIMESHGGNLSISLFEGHTCFILDLPINPQKV